MSRIGDKIRDSRNKMGISAKQFAKRLGVAENFVIDVETGKKIMNEDMIKKVEKTFGISLEDDIFTEVSEPVENLKNSNEPKTVNKQWEDAFSNIIKKIPVTDMNFKEIHDYKYLPVIDKKVEGYNSEKILFIDVPDDSMRGFRIQRNDRLMVFQNTEIVNNSISVVEYDGKRCIRQIKRLDSNKVLLISNSNDIKTETVDAKSLNVIGRCVKLEVDLV